MPDERHPLDERAGGADHPVEPPEVIVAPGIGRSERPALVVTWRRADELLAARMCQRADSAVEAELRHCCDLALAGAEARTPEQALGLHLPKGPLVDGNAHPASVIGSGGRIAKGEGGNVVQAFRKDADGAALLRDAAEFGASCEASSCAR